MFGSLLKHTHAREQEEGFVLAEMLVAMIVLSIAAVSFLQIVQEMAMRTRRIKTETSLSRVAVSLIDVAANRSIYDTSPIEGRDEKTGYNWSVRIKPDENRRAQNSEQPSLLKISVEVWKDGQTPVLLTSVKWVGQ